FFVHSGSPWASPAVRDRAAGGGVSPLLVLPIMRIPRTCTYQYVSGPRLRTRARRLPILTVPRSRGPPPVAPASRPSGRGLPLDPLLDGAEDAAALAIEHLDPHPVAEGQERRHRLAGFQRLDRAPLGETRGAGGGVLVGDRARADQGAGRQRPGPGHVRHQLGE